MDKKNFYILLDAGHGINTKGKCSPDQSLREYKYCREIVDIISNKLTSLNYNVIKITPEETDTSLTTRVQRVNSYCDKYGSKNCVLISVHNNASPPVDGKWHKATGWSGWVSRNCSQNSKKLAQILYAECELRNLQGNRNAPKEKYWQADFYIIKKTKCPAILTENLFQDNKEEVEYLLSDKGKDEISQLHVDGLIKYIDSL